MTMSIEARQAAAYIIMIKAFIVVSCDVIPIVAHGWMVIGLHHTRDPTTQHPIGPLLPPLFSLRIECGKEKVFSAILD